MSSWRSWRWPIFSDDLERGVLSALLTPGDFILVQGLLNFARQNSKNRGLG
jgi:hypothetical protein